MLKLFGTLGFHELYRCSHFVASGVTKRQLMSVVPVCHHRVSIPARHFSAGIPVRKDALQPKGEKSEEIDLDKWKSVMRSKAVSEKKLQVNDDEDVSGDDDENLKELGGDSKDSSLLEATRDLVVMWRQAGKLVPQEITDEEVQALAALTTKSSKKKYLKYLAIKEGHKRIRKEKQQKRKAEREAIMEQRREQGRDAEVFKNSFILQFWNRSLDKLLAWRSAQAMMFGQPLVFDLSYDSNMTRREIENTVSQLMEVEAWNRRATDPYHLHFCNLQPGGAYNKELLKRYGAETWDHLFITSTDRQHVDVFPHEQLVYLTADSPNVLHTFDHSKVYIIGALVDRSIQSGLSLANAKRLKLATARLPLDEYLHWEIGAKNLTLDQMIRIMLTIKEKGKWEEALEFVPKRKHDGFHQQPPQKQIISNRVRGVSSHDLREATDRPLKSGERYTERTFKNVDQSLYRTQKEPKFTSRDRMDGLLIDRENKPAATRVRTSFKSNMERRKTSQRKMWWED
ncbi:mitochondrial ribonuclease P protein 1 [Lates japonicus]|uniref:tRNA methyltransferase 10 homolog C n=1 Tax=Lates japonicus TaxID=270547 RepID=A0AAD3QXM1_LATJO|nr:mitochondrial ribonuclease P protein 1 [Lates japonicus]GLD70572.1 mitochondrial ribonuclease P protein 1 [Lates japonicus]